MPTFETLDIWTVLNYFFAAGDVVSLLLLPGFVALIRKHRNTPAIFATSLLLGWTVIGWAVALVWSLTNEPRMRGR